MKMQRKRLMPKKRKKALNLVAWKEKRKGGAGQYSALLQGRARRSDKAETYSEELGEELVDNDVWQRGSCARSASARARCPQSRRARQRLTGDVLGLRSHADSVGANTHGEYLGGPNL